MARFNLKLWGSRAPRLSWAAVRPIDCTPSRGACFTNKGHETFQCWTWWLFAPQ